MSFAQLRIIVYRDKRLIRHLPSGYAMVEPTLINAPYAARKPICELIAAHKMHEVRLDKQYLLLGKLRLYQRNSPLGKVALRDKSRLLRYLVKRCSLIRIKRYSV